MYFTADYGRKREMMKMMILETGKLMINVEDEGEGKHECTETKFSHI